jgi:4-amino-4-deoxy-L-arabinose transferase-like glycosyltransferase
VRNHPEEFAAQFFSDQVTGKVSFDPLRVLRQLPGYFATGVISFFGLPLVLAVAWWRSSPRAEISSWPFVFKLLLAWALAVPVMFSFGPFVAGRYLLPVLPIAAVLTVIGFTALARGPETLGRAAVWILVPVALIEIVLLGFGSAIEFQLAPLLESAIFIGMAAALAAWALSAVRNPARAPFALTWSFILTFALIFMPIARLVMPSIAVPIAARLNAAPASPLPLVSIHQDAEMYLRLLTGRATPFRSLESNDFGDACTVVTDQAGLAENLKARGFSVETIQGGYDPELEGLFEAVVEWRLAQARREKADTVYFARCKS